jgi:bifunctional DNase/RNase
MKTARVKMGVRGVAMDANDSTPIVILREVGGDKALPVVVGPAEASSIIIELDGLKPPRPLTHDLIVSLLDAHGFTFLETYIYQADGDSYLARIRYRKGAARYEMDVRPSDGIALAVRAKSPIWVEDDLIRSAPAINYLGLRDADERREIYYMDPEWRPRQSL